jgi:23S rRNA (guanosine2251-2'-O)-methyltransferase
MKATTFQIRECENPACGLRFPVEIGHQFGERCPACLGHTREVMTCQVDREIPIQATENSPFPFEILLDNIRSGLNVGSLFRTADGFGLRHLYLCGITPTPKSADLGKTALGAEKAIPWSYHKNAVLAAEQLKADGYILWALEQDARAKPIKSMIKKLNIFEPTAKGIILIAGNEETGVDPDLLKLCKEIFYLPMRGIKRSLNVSVACGIAISFISDLLKPEEV